MVERQPAPALLRPVERPDAPAIHALIDGIFSDYDCRLNLAEDVHLLDPGAWFRARDGEFWVAEAAGQVIGTVAVYRHGQLAELKSLYVRQDRRREGLGRRLSELAIDHARRLGVARIILWTDTRFTDAHRLYERLGFRMFGVRDLGDTNGSIEYGYWRVP